MLWQHQTPIERRSKAVEMALEGEETLDSYRQFIEDAPYAQTITTVLDGLMHFCRLYRDEFLEEGKDRISFETCLQDARKRFNREVREEALTKPLPAK